MSYTTPPTVKDYLLHIEKYFKGDLNTFHNVCQEIEKKELELNSQMETTSSITVQTTMTPVGDGTSGTLPTESSKNSGSSGNHGTSGHGGYDPTRITSSFRMTTPITLTLFSVIDIIGYLTSTNKEDENKKNIEHFLSSFIGNGKVSQDELNVLISVFRHGMTHTFFPKLDVGLSYHSTNQGKKLFFILNEHGYNLLTLNVNYLENLVVSKLDQVLSDIKGNNQSTYNDMENQFSEMLKVYNNGKVSKTYPTGDFSKSSKYYLDTLRNHLSLTP